MQFTQIKGRINIQLFLFIFLLMLYSESNNSQVISWSSELARTLMERFTHPWDFGYPGRSYSHGHMLEGIDLVRLSNVIMK